MRPYLKICVPVYDIATWDHSLAKACFEQLKGKPLSFDCDLRIQQGTVIEECRNTLINGDRTAQAKYQKIPTKYSHLLFLDHDVGYVWENVERLLAHDKLIVSGAYRPKADPHSFVAGLYDDIGKITTYISSNQTGLIKVGWIGAGFLLVKREALERMAYPWYWKKTVAYGNRVMTVGEDIYFCLNAREHLMDVWLDCDCILNHEINRYQEKRNEDVSDSIVLSGTHL